MRVVGAPWGHQSAGIFWAFKQGARRHIGDFGASGTVRRTSNFAGPNNKRANFLKEAVSHGPACFSKSPSPASKGPKPSGWSHLRGVVTPGARQSQVDSRRSPMSSRPSSPRSEETKSSLPASPEVSLSPSRWQLPRTAARVLSRSVSPNSWKAAASRAEQEGRAQAAAEIALLRMSSGIPTPRQARPTTPEAVNPEGKTVSATELALLSSISTSAGTGGSAQSSPRQRRADEGIVPNLQRHERRGLLDGVHVQTEDALPAKRPLHSDSPREKNKWSPCKWPPSSRWPSSQLPRNVNQWPLAGDDKPAGLDTWTHILFTTGLRRSPSASPTRGATQNPSATSASYKSRHSDRPSSARLARSARSASACDVRSFSQGSSPRTPRSPRSPSQSRKLHQSVSQSKLHKSLSDRGPGVSRERAIKASQAQASQGPAGQGSLSRRETPRANNRNSRNSGNSRPREPQISSRARRTASRQREPSQRHKPTPADLVRMQKELQSQIERVSRALDGASVSRAPSQAKSTGRKGKELKANAPSFRF